MTLWVLALMTAFIAPWGPRAQAAEYASPPPRVVAEVIVAGEGARLVPRTRGVRVFDDGQVVHFQDQRIESFLTLSPGLRAKFNAQVDRIEDMELVDLDEDKPYCSNVPSTSYRIFHGRSAPILIAASRDCHRYALPSEDVDGVTRFLDRLLSLDLKDLI